MSTEHQETRPGAPPRSTGQDATLGNIGSQTQEAAEQAKTLAIERAEQLRKSAESAKARAAERVRKFGSAVRWVGESLRHEDEAFVARYADTASQRIEELASYIDSASPKDVLDDVHNYARQKPAWFFGGALMLGLSAGRFLKSTSAPAGGPRKSGDDRERVSDRGDRKADAERERQVVGGGDGGIRAGANGAHTSERSAPVGPGSATSPERQQAQRRGRDRDGGARR